MPAPERRGAHRGRPFHDDEARSLQMLHEPIGDDAGHEQREGERLVSLTPCS